MQNKTAKAQKGPSGQTGLVISHQGAAGFGRIGPTSVNSLLSAVRIKVVRGRAPVGRTPLRCFKDIYLHDDEEPRLALLGPEWNKD